MDNTQHCELKESASVIYQKRVYELRKQKDKTKCNTKGGIYIKYRNKKVTCKISKHFEVLREI